DEALVRGDEELLSIAIENLLGNAEKYSRSTEPVRLALSEVVGRVELVVSTPGARIGAAERDRLFDRFYRAADARAAEPGHGLGLPLARHVARLHGGDVDCVSRPDEDAAFRLSLPRWSGTPPASGAADAPAPPAPAVGETAR